MPTQADPRLKIEYRPLVALIPYARNARTHSDEQVAQVAASIREFGWTNPILVDGENGVIAGHARLMAARKLGMDEVPVIELAGLSEAQKRAYVLADNRLALNAGWDEEMLALELADLKDLAVDLDLLGFSERELQQLLDRLGDEGGLTDPDEIPELPEEPVTQPGDLWLLGDHRVLCGDATDPHDVEIVMDGQLAACCWTDPPYGVSYVGGTKKKLTIKNDDADGLRQLLEQSFAAVHAALAPGAAIYVAHPAGAGSVTFGQCFLAQGWRLHQTLVWVKEKLVPGHSDYHYRHEPILFGYRPAEAGRRGRGSAGWYGGNDASSVFEFPSAHRNEEHPTSKPVGLVAAMVRNSSRTGDVVLDPFLGSGSTLVACEQLGRRCFGIDLDPRYVDVAVRRWERFTGRKAERVEGELRENEASLAAMGLGTVKL
jgi:DNA modification methylase